jgi:hypothetical protein
MEFSPKCVHLWESKVFVNPIHVADMGYDQVWEYLCVDGKYLFPEHSDPIKASIVVTVSSRIDIPTKPKSIEYGVRDKPSMMDGFHFESESQEVIVLKDGVMSNPKTDVTAYMFAVKELSLVLGIKAVGITMKCPSRKQRNLDVTSPKFGIDAKYLEDKVERDTKWVVKEVVDGVVIEQRIMRDSKPESLKKSKLSGDNPDQFELFSP